MIPIFVGYDEREAVGFPVFCHSVLARTAERVSFEPVRGIKRPESSTSFEPGRWSVPGRCGFRGIAVWAECDMLCLANIAELVALLDSNCDVMVVKHDYRTRFPVKFLGQKNEDYPRKNWSSLMVFNCNAAVWRRIEDVQPKLSDLHRFPESITVGTRKVDLFDQDRIGALPMAWNHLVGEYMPNPAAKLAHFTIGLPIWPEYADCEHAAAWRAERDRMLYAKPYAGEATEAAAA